MVSEEERERQALIKLRDKYQERADRYWHDYQIDGMRSQLTTYERNERMANALTDAINGKRTKARLADLRVQVASINTKDPEQAIRTIEYIQKEINEGNL